ncbi:phage protein [Streptococcus pneumoniae]|nr:phage protein [Streptococcus pneumoniae]VLM38455.1 phage protein [Streptococcus pneumoniae]VMB58462.1 phage protein [Streptococcus pneumoniae]VMQ08770.1 phage protein [Streptococcus pneumoniae]VNY78828.1 phage protein [Streptococcus pneumoniae]
MVELFLKELKQLDEPQKVKIPQFVADWIEVCKEHLTTSLYTAMTPNFMKENNQSFDLILWIKKASNQDLFARAWLNGYEVEEEKRYLVTLKNRQPLVKSQSGSTLYFSQDITARNYKGTQKELEEAKFGWVFDCEGIDIEEVE